MQPTLTPTLTPTPENQQTAEPTQPQTADSNWKWLPLLVVSAVLLITAGAVVYLKKTANIN
jgi:LPXTG-motif cell wall-anchored protein